MPYGFDSVSCGNQLQLGSNDAQMFVGIRGAGDLQGPVLVGSNGVYPLVSAGLMVAPLINPDSPTPFIAGALCYGAPSNPFSFSVVGSSAFLGNVETNADVVVGGNLLVQGNVISNCNGHILAAKKNFDIPHPTKEGWRLRHTCPEGPSNDVYIRGKLKDTDIIELPEYWRQLVDPESITVSITPVGRHQEIIVNKIEDNKVFLQSHTPIECHYHIYGERTDGEKLIPEYEGETPADYPGNNDEYSVSGYHYDRREV